MFLFNAKFKLFIYSTIIIMALSIPRKLVYADEAKIMPEINIPENIITIERSGQPPYTIGTCEEVIYTRNDGQDMTSCTKFTRLNKIIKSSIKQYALWLDNERSTDKQAIANNNANIMAVFDLLAQIQSNSKEADLQQSLGAAINKINQLEQTIKQLEDRINQLESEGRK